MKEPCSEKLASNEAWARETFCMGYVYHNTHPIEPRDIEYMDRVSYIDSRVDAADETRKAGEYGE